MNDSHHEGFLGAADRTTAAHATARMFEDEFPGETPEAGWLETAYEVDSANKNWPEGAPAAYEVEVRAELARMRGTTITISVERGVRDHREARAEIAALPDDLLCDQCGKPMFFDVGDISHHAAKGVGVDYDADRDHVALNNGPRR